MMEIAVSKAPHEAGGPELCDLQFPGDFDGKNRAIDEVLALLASRRNLDAADTFRLRLCLDESIQNAIDHSHRGDPTKRVAVRVYETPEGWDFVVRDEGPGFESLRIPDLDDPETLLSEGGRGLLILQEYMESIRYHDGGRTLVLSWRKRPAAVSPAS